MAARAPNVMDLTQRLNGSPQFLGAIVSTGAAQSNLTTATPFAQTATNAQLAGTLAGKTLLLQTSAAGLILGSTNGLVTLNLAAPALIALQSVLPPAAGTLPGVALLSGERVIVTMGTQEGWLQFLPLSGSANLLVFELV